MEEKKTTLKMKKTIATLLVTVGLAVAAFCGVGLLSLAVSTDALDVDVEDWLQDKDYGESNTLAWHMASDVSSVIRYMGLQHMLEDNGTLNMDRPALVVQYEDGSIVTYTIEDLVALGEENGIYVYDEAREIVGDVSYYITAPMTEEMENTRVRVLWSLMDESDSAVDLDADVWAVRQARIDEVIAAAKAAGVPAAEVLIPDERELEQLTTEELLDMCQNLAVRYPGAQAIRAELLSQWTQELRDLRASEQEIRSQILEVEESTTEVAAEPTQETTMSPVDENEEAMDETAPQEESDRVMVDLWNEDLEEVRRWESALRDQMYDVLDERRENQKTSWYPLYDELQMFLRSYLEEYYYLRRTMEEPGNLNYRIVLTQDDQTVMYTDADTAENNGQLVSTENWDMSYSYDSTTRRIETTLPGSIREDPIWALQNWSYRNYDSATITFGIDANSLTYQDAYWREADSYSQYRNQVFMMVGAMAVCALLVLVGMIWLVPLCGRKDNVEGIYLNLYDRIPTELAAFGMFLLLMGMFLILVQIPDFLHWIMYNSVAADVRDWMMTGMAAALLILVYLLLWLGLYGLLRRIKAKTFWKNSLCAIALRWCLKPLGWCLNGLRWCGAKIKAGWNALLNNGDVTWKTLAAFIAYLFINFCLFIMFMDRYSSGFYLLLMLAFNVLVAAMLVTKSSQRKLIRQNVTKIASGNLDHHLPLQNLTGEERKLAEQINRISGGLKTAVEDSLKNERMKTELITNVSHDIKTPLTSIINYVDLLKREHIEDPKIQNYIDILDQKSQRLKTLTEDLVEASKASSGTLKLSMEKIDFVELINQTNGEFTDRFEACNLSVVSDIPETPAYIMADGRYVWRILENLYRNAEKYSMPGTRIYIEVFEKIGRVYFVMKNVSNAPLNFKAEELTERFIRGDVSRTTEGSGLGLSIAKDMTELMNGTFRVYLDGDLFRVTVSFAVIPNQKTDLKEMEDSIRRRVAEEEKKVQVETADVVSESGFGVAGVSQQAGQSTAQNAGRQTARKTAQKTSVTQEDDVEKERIQISLPKVKLPKLSLPKRKKKEENVVEDDDFFEV